MQEAGVLTTGDLDGVHMMAEAWGTIEQANYDITHDEETGKKRTMGEYRKARKYNRKNMPEVMERKEAWDLYLKLAREFGLTPASRNKIDLSKDKPESVDPVEEIYKGTNG